jgi:hypothetical protein
MQSIQASLSRLESWHKFLPVLALEVIWQFEPNVLDFCFPSLTVWLQHSHSAGITRTQGCKNHDDLHPCF